MEKSLTLVRKVYSATPLSVGLYLEFPSDLNETGQPFRAVPELIFEISLYLFLRATIYPPIGQFSTTYQTSAIPEP